MLLYEFWLNKKTVIFCYRYIHFDFNFHPYDYISFIVEIFINGLRKKALLFINKRIHFGEY